MTTVPMLPALALIAAAFASAGAAGPAGLDGFTRDVRPPFTYFYTSFDAGDLGRVERRLASRLPVLSRELGVDPPPEIAVVLLSPDREEGFLGGAPLSWPRWVQGFAVAERQWIVVRLRALSGYPYQDAGSVAEHELVHLLLARAAGPRAAEIPRWFHEGCAMLMAREWGFGDWSRLLPAALEARVFPLSDLERGFPEEETGARLAYAESFSFVRHLLERREPGFLAHWLALVRGGAPFAEAYRVAAGRTLAEEERAWREEVDFLYRWIPLAGSSLSLWAALSVIVVAGYIRKRRRTKQILKRWEEEEGPAHPEDPGETIH